MVDMESTKPLITISGPPAAGTSTLSDALESELGFEHVNGGDIFRSLANEKDLSLAELTELSEEDESIDKEVDSRLKRTIEKHLSGEREPNGDGLIVESRLAAWHAEGRADLSIHLYAPTEVRAERIEGRDETVDELEARQKSEAERYEEYYDIDITDKSVYDLEINTNKLDEKQMVEKVISAAKTGK
jgi:cytidylate kinase